MEISFLDELIGNLSWSSGFSRGILQSWLPLSGKPVLMKKEFAMAKQVQSALISARKYMGVVALGGAALVPTLYQVALLAR